MRQVIIEDMFSSKKAKTILPFYLFTLLLFLSSCSMTKNIPEGDQLVHSSGAVTIPYPGLGICGYMITIQVKTVSLQNGWSRTSDVSQYL